MKRIILILSIIFIALSFTTYSKTKLTLGVYGYHFQQNELHNNSNELIAINQYITDDVSLMVGTMKNSYENRCYMVGFGKDFFAKEKVSLNLSIGLVKGYNLHQSYNGMIVNYTNLEKMSFLTENLRIMATASINYNITENVQINAMYYGAGVMVGLSYTF